MMFWRQYISFSWRKNILTISLISILVALGFWQLHRATEKTNMLEKAQRAKNQLPVFWSPEAFKPKQYQTISVQGRFLNIQFLLDNQHNNHRFGYDVINALRLSNGQILLVDRGFIPANITRQQMPLIKIPQGVIDLSGYVYYPAAKSWVLGVEIEQKSSRLIVLERIKPALIAQKLNLPVYPFVLRLAKTSAYGYKRDWAVVSMPPERHQAYALQWFGLALVVLIMYLGTNKKTYE